MCHCSKTELERFRNCKMSVFRRFFYRLHLARCAECRKLQEEMDADDLLLTDLRQNHLTDEKIANGEKTYKKLCEYFKTIPGSTI